MTVRADEKPVTVRIGSVSLPGDLGVPPRAAGPVIFAHGTGSSRLSPRNRFVGETLRGGGIGGAGGGGPAGAGVVPEAPWVAQASACLNLTPHLV